MKSNQNEAPCRKQQVIKAIKQTNKLTKQTCTTYHVPALLLLGLRFFVINLQCPIGRTFSINFQ